MLQLINYDLQEPVKNYPALEHAIEEIGGGIHVLNGPWIIDTGKSSQLVLTTLITSLREAAEENKEEDRGDKLLVFPVQAGEISTGRSLRLKPPGHHAGEKVIAVSYNFRSLRFTSSARPISEIREDLIRALNEIGPTCHPLDAFWLVKTELSAHEVHLALEKAVSLPPNVELVVAEVDRSAKGAEEGLEPVDYDWLVNAGVLGPVLWPEAPTVS